MVDLSSWHLSWARDVSADGRVIVGQGVNPDGNLEAWLAVVPEPASLAMCLPLVVIAGLLAARRRRQQHLRHRAACSPSARKLSTPASP